MLGGFSSDAKNNKLVVLEPFKTVLELERGKPILDIKIAKIKKFTTVLAVTETDLYQMVGNSDNIKETLEIYQKNLGLIINHCYWTDRKF